MAIHDDGDDTRRRLDDHRNRIGHLAEIGVELALQFLDRRLEIGAG